MSYYGAKGDFYTGRTGYYRGDPGFFSSLGRLAGGVTSLFSPALGSAITGIFGGGGGPSPPPQPTISAAGSAGLGFGTFPTGSTAGRRSRMRGRLSAAAGMLPGMGMGRVGAAAVPGQTFGHRGMRVGGRRGHRMNVCNPRALRRAIRRAKGFEKLALRSIRLVSPQRLHGRRRGGFKVSRRRK